MRNVASIKLTGSVVKRDERTTPGGLLIITLTVAGDYPNRDGSKRIPYYQQVELLGGYAEYMRDQVGVGAHVTVLGSLKQSRWESADGGKRSSVEITVDSIAPLAGVFSTVTDKKGQVRLTDGQNSATLLGNLTRDAELRYTPNGKAVTNISIAVNTRTKDGEHVSYYDITAWDELAEQVAALKKGAPILVEGPLNNESWTDNEGNTRYRTRFEAFTLHPIRRPAGAGKTDDPAEQQPNPEDLTPPTDPLEEFPPGEELPF